MESQWEAVLDKACIRLSLTAEDCEELRRRVRQMGAPDPVLRERIFVEQVGLQAAMAAPLTRTRQDDISTPDVGSSAFVETFWLPSGRLLQVRRRYPSEEELHRALRGGTYIEPALWIREITLTQEGEISSIRQIESATVRDLY